MELMENKEQKETEAIPEPQNNDVLPGHYKNMSYGVLDHMIRMDIQSLKLHFISLGFYLKEIRDRKLYLSDGYSSVNEYAMDRYKMDRSMVSRSIMLMERFSVGGCTPILDNKWEGFSKSQLIEMAGLEEDQLEQVTPETTVAQLRDLKRQEDSEAEDQIEGQMDIMDFPEYLPDDIGGEEESFEINLMEFEEDDSSNMEIAADLFGEVENDQEEDAVAISQPETEEVELILYNLLDIQSKIRELEENRSETVGTPAYKEVQMMLDALQLLREEWTSSV